MLQVYILPTIRINNGQYRGKLGYADVLKAVCAGFNHGLEPGVCSKLVSTNCRPGSQGDTECLARYSGALLSRLCAYTTSCLWHKQHDKLVQFGCSRRHAAQTAMSS